MDDARYRVVESNAQENKTLEIMSSEDTGQRQENHQTVTSRVEELIVVGVEKHVSSSVQSLP